MTSRLDAKIAARATVAPAVVPIHCRGEAAPAVGRDAERPSTAGARPRGAADPSCSRRALLGTSHSLTTGQPVAQDDGSRAALLEQVILAECSAWLDLLTAVPDYHEGAAITDFTPAELELLARYGRAHAARLRTLG